MYNNQFNNGCNVYLEYIIIGSASAFSAYSGIKFFSMRAKHMQISKMVKTTAAAAGKVIDEFKVLMEANNDVADVQSEYVPNEHIGNRVQSILNFFSKNFGEEMLKTADKIGSVFASGLDKNERVKLLEVEKNSAVVVEAADKFLEATLKLDQGLNIESIKNELTSFQDLTKAVKDIDLSSAVDTLEHLPTKFYLFAGSVAATAGTFLGYATQCDESFAENTLEKFSNITSVFGDYQSAPTDLEIN